MDPTPAALIVATMDTKGREALFIADCLKKALLNLSPHHINEPDFDKSVLGTISHQVSLPNPDVQNEFDCPDSTPNSV
jgi:hypothetical protein